MRRPILGRRVGSSLLPSLFMLAGAHAGPIAAQQEELSRAPSPAVSREGPDGEREANHGVVVRLRAGFGVRPQFEMGAVRTIEETSGIDVGAFPTAGSGLAYAIGAELAHSRWPISLEVLFERSEHDVTAPAAPFAFFRPEGNPVFRARASLTAVSASVRVSFFQFAGTRAWPYVALGGGSERVVIHPVTFCVVGYRCDDPLGSILGEFGHTILRIGVGTEILLGRHALFVEVADALGSLEFPLGDLPGEFYVSIPGRDHALALTIGFRGQLLGPSR